MTQQYKWRCKYCDLGSNSDAMDFDREGLCRANPRALAVNHTWQRVEETPEEEVYECECGFEYDNEYDAMECCSRENIRARYGDMKQEAARDDR